MSDTLIHVMIVWSEGLSIKDNILLDLENDFKVLNSFEFKWGEEYFHENLKRFYSHSQKHLDEEALNELINNKINHCGNGNFLVIVFEDINPTIKERITSSGKNLVNINVFDKKVLYRKILDGGHQIHTSDNSFESNKDITLLFGCTLDEFKLKYPKITNIQELSRNILGVPFWKSLKELFFVLNNSIDYVILRNFESIPETYQMEGHGDIDLLVENINYVKYLTGAQNVFPETQNRVYHEIEFTDRKVPFDFRFLGDNYYDKKWQLHILKKKEYDARGFFKPNTTDHFYSLLYHAYVQKPNVAEDYKIKLKEFSKGLNIEYHEQYDDKIIDLLNNFMTFNRYNYTIPKDVTVFFNEIFIKQLKLSFVDNFDRLISSSINRSYNNAFITEIFEFDDYFLKIATNPISKNEYKFSSILNNSIYFPNYISLKEKGEISEVSIERVVGHTLNEINYNKQFWSISNIILCIEHCINILIILAENNITHRDIRPQNIIISKKEGKYIPVLIDFGWSSLIGEDSVTPIGLGASERWHGIGFSDAHSMGKTLETYFGRFDFALKYIQRLKDINPEKYSDKNKLIDELEKVKIELVSEVNGFSVINKLKIIVKKHRILEKLKRIGFKKAKI